MLQIKKYPNRRYYDATRSCHVTLQEVYDLVRSGHDVSVTDSRTGEDITNLILLQVMLEKDQPKLDVFPSSILHLMIRSNRQALHTMYESFFGPYMKMLATSQRQFDSYFRQTMGGPVRNPMDWANEMMRAFTPAQPPPSDEQEMPPFDPSEQNGSAKAESIEDLRRQLADLTRMIQNLQAKNNA